MIGVRKNKACKITLYISTISTKKTEIADNNKETPKVKIANNKITKGNNTSDKLIGCLITTITMNNGINDKLIFTNPFPVTEIANAVLGI
jgi:hypothetical protein